MTGEMYDYLTSLYNRKGMYEVWKETFSKEERVQLLFLDLDNFKMVNDIYGHRKGDEVLIRTGEILWEAMPGKGTVVRLGGDEFVILLQGEKPKAQMQALAEELLNKIRAEAKKEKTFDMISASVGVVWNAYTDEGIDQLLSYGDTAMYYAKESGKNRYIFFDDYAERIREEYEVESTAAAALEEGRFHLLYYPVMHLQNEKLLRTIAVSVWERENGECWQRSRYERILEKSGYIRKIDLYIFEQLCREFAAMSRADHHNTIIGIRISYLTLEEDVMEQLQMLTGKYGIPKQCIELLLDERFLGGRSAAHVRRSMQHLKEAGFSVGLMNFGEDFSALRYLESLPISTVFFDKEYVREEREDARRRNIVQTLFLMTKSMHLLSIGQGVSTTEDVEYLLQNGCDGASGSFYTPMLPLEKYTVFVEKIKEKDNVYVYDFKHRLSTLNGKYTGKAVGGIEFVRGISERWGGLRFGGGPVNTNLLQLPGELLSEGSFTVSMWLRPAEVQNWISVFYARMRNGFVSFMPTVSGNICMFRMHDDGDGDQIWTDNMAESLPIRKWTFVTLVYDAFSNMTRLFLNGKLVKIRHEIPRLGAASQICLGGDCYQVSYRGDVSALCIYDVPLTGEEVLERYEQYTREEGFCGDEDAEAGTEYMTHDPAIYEDPVSGRFYIYATGGEGMVSEDLEQWTGLGSIVEEVPQEAEEWTGSKAIWAPDIVKVGNEYRLYCSNSSWGVQRSCIFLAVSDRAEGPFRPRSIVLKTDDTLAVNGIDANIIEDRETGEQYMLYGSFWGGVHLLPLDKESGLARDRGVDGNGVGSLRLDPQYAEGTHISSLPQEVQDRRMGICLAARPGWTSGAIEGPYMIYHPESGYYFLFVSYGSLKNDYNIRIGRSRKVTGPFLDYFGRDLKDTEDAGCTRGLMISAGYRWLTGIPYMGPGHNSVLQRADGEMYLVSHIRKMQFMEKDCGPGLLQIRRLFATPDGWLMAGAQPYAAETVRGVDAPAIPGVYERIELRPSLPQGIAHAHPLILHEDGRLECCSIIGNWEQVDEHTLKFAYGPVKEYVHMENGLDHDINKTTVLLSGLSSQGICSWAKKDQ